jgi:hypothetical protein
MAAQAKTTAAHLAALIEKADFSWEKHQPVPGRACIAIPCRTDEVEGVISILFDTARQIDNEALRYAMRAAISTAHIKYDKDIVRLYWPDLLVSDSPK